MAAAVPDQIFITFVFVLICYSPLPEGLPARKQGLDNETIAKMSDDELGAFHAKHTSKAGFVAKIVVFLVLLCILLLLLRDI